MVNPDWYPAWRHDALYFLLEQNEALSERFKLGSWPRYDYDLSTRRLTFSEHGKAKVVADFKLLAQRAQMPETGSGHGAIHIGMTIVSKMPNVSGLSVKSTV